MAFEGVDLVAISGGGGDGNNVSVGGADPGSEGTEINRQIINLKRKGIGEDIVNILETGLKSITVRVELTGSHLADGVGKLIIGRGFAAGGHIEITPFQNIVIGRKSLGSDKSRSNNQ